MDDASESWVSSLRRSETIEVLDIEKIRVLNPRTRNQYFFTQLVESISSVGLKRPITVSRGGRDESGDWYEVLCGQGRLEALKALGETQAPCSVVEASQIDRFLITLTENIARRKHSSVELLNALQVMRARGHTTDQIAEKTSLDPTYVNSILHLLENGEKRLLHAVETRLMPLNLAVNIARATDDEVQAAMVSAYESGLLKGEQLIKVRKLLSRREATSKRLKGYKPAMERPTPQKLLRAYQNEVRRQKMVVHNARLHEDRLLLIISALKRFLSDGHFRTLLRAEGIRDIPEAVACRLPSELML